MQERIFEPFVTSQQDRRPDQGVGRGLTITRRLVLLHGGSLSVDSQPGRGSVFHVHLPLPGLGAPAPTPAEEAWPALVVIAADDPPPASIIEFGQRQGWAIRRLSPQAELAAALTALRPAALAWDLTGASLGNPFAIFMFRQFFVTVPKELEEAMVIDGAGYLRIFWSLMPPLSAPPTVSIFILTWLAEWSGLLKQMLFTTSKEMYTLQVGLNFLNRGAQVTTPTVAYLMAGIVLASIPPIVMFLILQRRFVQSVAQTGLKG